MIAFCFVGLFAVSISSCKSSKRCTGFTTFAGATAIDCIEGNTLLACLMAASMAGFVAGDAFTKAASSAAIDFLV